MTVSSSFLKSPSYPTNLPLPPNAFAKLNIYDIRITRKNGQMLGIEFTVNRETGTIVSKIHDDSPAHGLLHIGDQIVKIEGIMIAGMTTSKVLQLLRNLKDVFVFTIRRL